MTDDLIEITMRDLRVGMGIGGFDMEYTATHEPTGCKVVWQQHGAYPHPPHKMRERALMALELMTEIYFNDR